MLSENKKEIKNKIRDYFTERNDISAVYIFGSFNTERFNQNSDLDLAVIEWKSARKPRGLAPRKEKTVLNFKYYI